MNSSATSVYAVPPPSAPTLDNCDREPIHIPGSIQSHGALLAIDAARTVRFASANTAALIGFSTRPGDMIDAGRTDVDTRLLVLVDEGLDALAGRGELPMPAELTLQGRSFDVVLHVSGALLVVEFEPREHSEGELAGFAVQAHRALEKLRRPRAINDLLQLATQELRALTGFDRVMAYRFRHDSSGEVVAESRNPALDEYLGRRYPASDIPAQARRLYVVNTLRLIADVRSTPMPLLQDSPVPLDMTSGLLRSVSPIHIEYLSNMGVGASMSVSIVINDQLWGMIVCHHMAARRVPFSVRMACDVIAQLLSANIYSEMSRRLAERQQAVGALRTRLLASVLHADDEFSALCDYAAPLAESLRCDAVLVAEHSKLCTHGTVDDAASRALVHWLATHHAGTALFHTAALPSLTALAPDVATLLAPWCGVLALPLDRDSGGWLVFLRKEQIETIHWGGKPDKELRPGPLGPRLTPRGSFDLWKEIVRGTSVHWSTEDLETAQQLLNELVRTQNARHAELNRARAQLMAVLGHDLRDPLHSISMAARVLEKSHTTDGHAGRIGQRIQSSSSRMQRLVSQVMDMSRLQGKLGLNLEHARVDLVPLLTDLIDEMRTAHPGTQLAQFTPDALDAWADADRMAQVFANLLGNARHHGELGVPIEVRATSTPEGQLIEVRNVAAPISADLASDLFKPFKVSSAGNTRNRSGLGLGLYIAYQIVQGHGGQITYRYEAPHVVFSVHLPTRPPEPHRNPATHAA